MGKDQNNKRAKIQKINARLIRESWRNTEENLSEPGWQNETAQRRMLWKRKKFCDNLLRKGFESNLVYEKVKELESMERMTQIVIKTDFFT
jgi:regulatory protein